MAADRPTVHVGDRAGLPSAPWTALPAEMIWVTSSEVVRERAEPEATPVVVVRLGSAAAADAERLRRVRERFPDAPTLAYSADDDPDAAIDAGRLGIEYVSGRRLSEDDETLERDRRVAASVPTVSSADERGAAPDGTRGADGR